MQASGETVALVNFLILVWWAFEYKFTYIMWAINFFPHFWKQKLWDNEFVLF